MERKIELCTLKAKDIKTNFGNPRKISKKKLEELEQSFDMFGDFGIFLVDESDNIIGGNQRLKVVLDKYGPDMELACKRLIGYTMAELRAINIKDNTHNGEWDLDLLADWTADLTVDLGLDKPDEDMDKRTIPDMEPIHYEKYDYVMIVCKNELDYNDLVRKLGIEGMKVKVAKTRKIKARAIWYDEMKCQITQKKEDDPETMEEETEDDTTSST